MRVCGANDKNAVRFDLTSSDIVYKLYNHTEQQLAVFLLFVVLAV